MPMKRSVPAANPDAYVVGLTGWRRACVEELRAGVRCAGRLEEVVKWGPARPAGQGAEADGGRVQAERRAGGSDARDPQDVTTCRVRSAVSPTTRTREGP